MKFLHINQQLNKEDNKIIMVEESKREREMEKVEKQSKDTI